MMKRGVILMRANNQIALVSLVATDMMNNFRFWMANTKALQRSAENLFSHNDMFVFSLPRSQIDRDVTMTAQIFITKSIGASLDAGYQYAMAFEKA